MRAHPFNRSRQAGFTLIEVVVAFVILSLVLGVVYESVGASLRRNASLQQREASWLVAQSLLSELRVSRTWDVADREGSTDGLKWKIAIRKSPVSDLPGADHLFEVTIHVAWGQKPSQQVRLQSMELQEAWL